MMIDLDAVDALVEDRTARGDGRDVVEHSVNDRVGDADLTKDVTANRTPHRLRNDVADERVAHHGATNLASCARVIKLPEDDGTPQRISPDLLARIRVARERGV